jgi:hypothetical protein
MITLDQAREALEAAGPGEAGVVYRPPHPGAEAEQGVITSVSTLYVYVRYSGDCTGSKATHPAALEFLAPGGGSDD